MKEFLKKKNIIFSAKRYGIDALGAMGPGSLCFSLNRYYYQYPGRTAWN